LRAGIRKRSTGARDNDDICRAFGEAEAEIGSVAIDNNLPLFKHLAQIRQPQRIGPRRHVRQPEAAIGARFGGRAKLDKGDIYTGETARSVFATDVAREGRARVLRGSLTDAAGVQRSRRYRGEQDLEKP
jgi:hypothetical protein